MILEGITVGIILITLLAHKYGPDWNYLFGLAFFAGFPAVEVGLAGFALGGTIFVSFIGFAYLMERILTGEWQEPQV